MISSTLLLNVSTPLEYYYANYTNVDANLTEPNDNVCLQANFTSLSLFQTCVRNLLLSKMRYMNFSQAAIYTFIYTCITVLGILGNGLVIFVVITKNEMRTTRNLFIINLALCNFLLALILVPFLWLPTYRLEFPYGSFMCKFAQSFPGTNIFCSALTVSVIAIDRYCAVAKSYLGPVGTQSTKATMITVCIWIISFILSIINLIYFDIKEYILPVSYIPGQLLKDSDENMDGILLFQRCQLLPEPCRHLDGEDSERCNRYFESAVTVIMALFIYVVPMPILIVFNFLLTKFLAENERQSSLLRHRAIPPVSTPRPAQRPVIGQNSSQSRTSSASRRRSRTTHLLFAMAFSNAILWLPFTVISIVIQLGPSHVINQYDYELRQLDDAAKLISMFSVCVNPFLYGYLNTNFKNEFQSIFRTWRRLCCPRCESNDEQAAGTLLPMTKMSPVSEDAHGLDDSCVMRGMMVDQNMNVA